MQQERPKAYLKAAEDPTKRIYCDFCSRCVMYNCDGSTARHHHIHIDMGTYFGMTDEEYKHNYLWKMGFEPINGEEGSAQES